MAMVWSQPIDPVTGLKAQNSIMCVQSVSEAAPSWPTDIGFSLVDVGGYTICVEADAGQTLAGTGSLTGYIMDLWGQYAFSEDLKLTIPSTAFGQRRYAWTNWTDANPRGVIAHAANSVGVTGGGVTIYYTATKLRGHRG